MEVAIRDGMIYQAGYPTAVEGMCDTGISTVEVLMDRAGTVRSLVGTQRLDLGRDEDLEIFDAILKVHGIRVCALLCGQDFNAADDPAAHRAWVVRAVRAAGDLGIPAVRIDSIMTGQKELPLEERVRLYAQATAAVLEATAGSRVALGIENHGPQGNDPAWMRSVLQRIGDPRVGVTLDVGNWYWYGHPLARVYEIYREFGPHVKATHVKNIAYPEALREVQREVGYEYAKYCCPLEDGDLDMSRIAAILRECGYDGALTIEDESLGKFPEAERRAVLKRDVEHLSAALGA